MEIIHIHIKQIVFPTVDLTTLVELATGNADILLLGFLENFHQFILPIEEFRSNDKVPKEM